MKLKPGDWVKTDGNDDTIFLRGLREGEVQLLFPDEGLSWELRRNLGKVRRPRKSWTVLKHRQRARIEVSRSNIYLPYTFYCVVSPNLRQVRIAAGCRLFRSFIEARLYYLTRVGRKGVENPGSQVGFAYPITDADRRLNKRSLAILDIFEAEVKQMRAKAKRRRAGRRQSRK